MECMQMMIELIKFVASKDLDLEVPIISIQT